MEDFKRKRREEVFSKRIKAGKRTYFIDVKPTKGQDYYITITESKRKNDATGYAKHKIFLYKEDFNKFSTALAEAVDHVKNELMPGFDFDKFTKDDSHAMAGNHDDFEIEEEFSKLKNDYDY